MNTPPRTRSVCTCGENAYKYRRQNNSDSLLLRIRNKCAPISPPVSLFVCLSVSRPNKIRKGYDTSSYREAKEKLGKQKKGVARDVAGILAVSLSCTRNPRSTTKQSLGGGNAASLGQMGTIRGSHRGSLL